MNPFFRTFRPAALLALAAFALTGCGEKPAASAPAGAASGAKPLTKIVLQTDWYAQPEHGGFYQALVKGYYREAGLEVQIVPGGPNAIPPQKVALGSAQFSIGRSDELAIAVSRGIPLQIVAALMQRDPQAIMFHEEGGISEFKDLDGRNVMAVPGSGWIMLMEKKFGITVSVTPLDFGLSRFMADKKFVQQCFITNEPYYVRQQGAKVKTLLLSGIGFPPYRVWYTSRSFAEKNPAIVKAFTAASIRGWSEYISGDRAEADRMIASLNAKMVPEFIAYSLATMRDYKLVAGDPEKGEAIGRIDPARIDEELRQLAALGVLGQPVKLADFFDPQFLPDNLRAKSASP